MVGALCYLTHTQPDISYAIGLVSRFMERPTVQHMKAVKHILRYVKGTTGYGLVYGKGNRESVIIGYTNNNLARYMNDRRIMSRMVFDLNENLVAWGSLKQRCVALSSYQAEFRTAISATCQAIWI